MCVYVMQLVTVTRSCITYVILHTFYMEKYDIFIFNVGRYTLKYMATLTSRILLHSVMKCTVFTILIGVGRYIY
jgi:hypothetical protein